MCGGRVWFAYAIIEPFVYNVVVGDGVVPKTREYPILAWRMVTHEASQTASFAVISYLSGSHWC